jgi:hypothetical protein
MEIITIPGGVPLPQRQGRGRRQQQPVVVQRQTTQQRLRKREKRRRQRLRRRNVLQQTLADYSNKGTLGDTSNIVHTTGAGLTVPQKIAHSIANPLMTNVQRLADEFSSNETAIASPFERVQAQWWTDTSPPAAPIVAPQGLPCFAFRNAERASVVYDANPAQNSWSYIFYGTDEDTQIPQTGFNINVRSGDRESLHIPYALPGSSSYQPHGKILMAGQCADKPKDRFFFLNGNETLTGTFGIEAATDTTYSFDVGLDFWDSDSGLMENIGTVLSQPAFAGGDVAINAPLNSAQIPGWKGPGYYALTVKVIPTVATVLEFNAEVVVGFENLTITSIGPCVGHRTLADYSINVNSVNGVRVQAVAVRYCNVAAMLSLEGQVSCYQVPQQQHWKDYLTNYDSIASSKGAQTFQVREGAYGFLKPTQPQDFDFQSYTKSVSGQLTDSFYPLKEESAFLVFFPVITTADGRSGFFEICHGVEYQTKDVWRNTDVAAANDEDFRKAKNILKDIPQFYSNSLHVGQILNNVRSAVTKGAKFVQKYGPSVLKGASYIAELLG